MPALYGITSNANVSVANTPGLYIGSGNVLILNSAQTLDNLLSNQGNVNFALTSDNSQVYAFYNGPINNYGNANVAAFLPTYTGTLGFGSGFSIGNFAAQSIYIGNQPSSPASQATSLGYNAGYTNQGLGSTAVGANAGGSNQGQNSIAIGNQAGSTNQGQIAVAVGANAGNNGQGLGAVAIGVDAGYINQGTNSIAIGNSAGAGNNNYQANNTIILNATGSEFDGNPGQTNSFYVTPIRNDSGNVAQTLYYNPTTKEITYYTTAVSSTYSNSNVAAYLAANTDPTIQNLNANTQQQQTQINSVTANLASFETYANVTFVTTANANTYSNSNVASYLSSGLVTTINTTGNITTTANVVATGNLSANNATVTNKITAGSILSTGNITANTGAYFIGDGSQLTNLPTQTGTYSNTNVAAYLSGNITTGNITNTGVITSTGNITAPYYLGTAQYFSGNLAGNLLYDGIKNAANIQATAFGNINPINSSVYSVFQQNGQGGVTTAAGGTISPAPAIYTTFAGNGITAVTTAGITNLIGQSNVTLRTASSTQSLIAQSFQSAVYGLSTNMSSNDRVKGTVFALEQWPQGGTWASNQFKAPGSFTAYNPAATAVSLQATTAIAGSGNAATVIGGSVLSFAAPTQGAVNVNYVTGLNPTFGWAPWANVAGTATSTIEVARGILITGSWGNAITGVNNQVINNMYGVHLPTAWENGGTSGHVITNLKRSLQSEDANTELYNAGNVIIGGNLITTNSNAVTFNGPTTVNNTITTTGNITAPNFLGTAQYFSGNLAGNILYNGTTGATGIAANIQAFNGVAINPIQANAWSIFQTTNASGTVSPNVAIFANLGGVQTVTTAGVTASMTQSNVLYATKSGTLQVLLGGAVQGQYFLANSTMNGNDRINHFGVYAEAFLQGQTWGYNSSGYPGNYQPPSGSSNANFAAQKVGSSFAGYGNVGAQIGLQNVTTVAPTTAGAINVNYQTAYQAVVGYGSWASGAQPNSYIDIARAFYPTGLFGNTTPGVQNITNLYGLHIIKNWENNGTAGRTVPNKRVIQNEDPNTDIFNAGNVFIGGNVYNTSGNVFMINSTSNVIVTSLPTTVNANLTVGSASNQLLTISNYTAATIRSIVGSVGQMVAVNDNGGQIAYWDTTNTRWSYINGGGAV